LLVAFVAAAGSAPAATFRSEDRIVVPRGEVLEDDLYAFGQTIVIEGDVRGDVVAFGSNVQVPGRVHGDLISATQDLRVDGRVDGSVRGAGQRLVLNGEIGKDAIVAGQSIDLSPQATVAGDVTAAGATLRLSGSVGGDVRMEGRKVALDGAVGGAVQARADEVSIGDQAVVKGPLEYRSVRQASIPSGAQVGDVRWQPAERRAPGPVWFLLGWLRLSIGLFALGLVAAWVAPKLAREAPATLRARPWVSLGIGAMALVAAPLVGAMVFGVGLLFGGWWLAALLFAALLIAMSLSFPTVGLVVGRWLVGRFAGARGGLALMLATGVVLLALVIRVPVVGALVAFAALVLGLGALLMAGWHLRRAPAPA
jgi:cytoskeletal protein CcmA (bactofilin family)